MGLGLIGLGAFIVVLLLFMLLTNFFSSPEPGIGMLPSIAGVGVEELDLLIEDSGFSSSEFTVPPNTLFVLRISNGDGRIHKVLLFNGLENGELEELAGGFFEPGEVGETTLLNSDTEEELLKENAQWPGPFMSAKLLVSCTTCESKGSQVMITAEKS